MRALIILAVLFISACSSTPKDNGDSAVDFTASDKRYSELVESIKHEATPEKFTEIREAYVHTSFYNPYFGIELGASRTMAEAINNEDWQACVAHADRILAVNYISLDAHFGASMCSFEAGNTERGEFHKSTLDGLIGAIWATGDGKTKETAFHTISTPELRSFIQLHGLEITGQALVHDENAAYDVMGVKDPEFDEEFDWYFNISTQWVMGFKELE